MNNQIINNHKNILTQEFFTRPTLEVCQDLLGKFLVRQLPNGQEIALMITEIEAYDGPHDLANHGRVGKTERTKIMFGPAGYWYVYLIYGMYWMLNIVTDQEEYPAAILIRGAGHISGPGKLTKFINIDKSMNGLIAQQNTMLWIEDRGIIIQNITRTPRIGIDYAGDFWKNVPYRFISQSFINSTSMQNNAFK